MNNFLDIDTLALKIKKYNRKIETLSDDIFSDFVENSNLDISKFDSVFEEFSDFILSNNLLKGEMTRRIEICEKFFETKEFEIHRKNIEDYYTDISRITGINIMWVRIDKLNIVELLTKILYKEFGNFKKSHKLLQKTLIKKFFKGTQLLQNLANISGILNSIYGKKISKRAYQNCKFSLLYLEDLTYGCFCFYVFKRFIFSTSEWSGLKKIFISTAIKEICENLTKFLEYKSEEYKPQKITFEELCRSSSLTKRERETLQLCLQDLSNEEIAKEMAITVKSVENYKNRLAPKIKAVLNIEEQVRFKDVVKALNTRIVIN